MVVTGGAAVTIADSGIVAGIDVATRTGAVAGTVLACVVALVA
jgi:hypothetical protein